MYIDAREKYPLEVHKTTIDLDMSKANAFSGTEKLDLERHAGLLLSPSDRGVHDAGSVPYNFRILPGGKREAECAEECNEGDLCRRMLVVSTKVRYGKTDDILISS